VTLIVDRNMAKTRGKSWLKESRQSLTMSEKNRK